MRVCMAMVSVLLLSSAWALAEEAGKDISTLKQEAQAGFDSRIAALQAAKSCVSAATTKEALKKCREGLKEKRKEMRSAHREKKRDKIDKRIKKLEEKKAKIPTEE